jgi:nitroreductase/NAD-dependent dihydropyrimidine dehydrogenase PreA subunit
MLSFEIDQLKCTSCYQCALDCPAHVIAMDGAYPTVATQKEAGCFKCQHCLAVCPTGALSILGRKPEDSIPLAENLPSPDQLERLIKGRRSIRSFRKENLPQDLLLRLVETANCAPTGVNARQVLFTVVDDLQVMEKLRQETMRRLADLAREGKLPQGRDYFNDCIRAWEEDGVDTIYRGAPHLVIASAPRNCPTPEADCLIALSYFEIFAQSLGVGTVWEGMARWIFSDLIPELRVKLGVPEDHLIGYVMAFGRPAISYRRSVQHPPAMMSRVTW